jgi:hypothetical protein
MKRQSMDGIDQQQIQELLTAVFTLCSVDKNLTPKVLDRLITNSRNAEGRRARRVKLDRRDVVDHDVIGHIIYIWQRTPRYLGIDGQPIALPARGAAPSIQALFKEVKRSSYFERGLKHLIRVKRIRRLSNNRYVPCADVTIVERLTPEMVKLLNQTIHWLVSTVLHNTSLRGPKALRLIERVASVPDLPSSQVRAFKVFSREQAGELIQILNEWLESRRGDQMARASASANNFTAGLHVFAFAEKNRR